MTEPTPSELQQAINSLENRYVKWVFRSIGAIAIMVGTWGYHRAVDGWKELNRKVDQSWRYTVWLHSRTNIAKPPSDVWTEPEK